MAGGPNRSAKFAVWARDGWRCRYCGVRVVQTESGDTVCATNTATVDHVHPRRLGGTNRMQNLVTACYACNQAKGSSTYAAAPSLADVWPSLNRAEQKMFSA